MSIENKCPLDHKQRKSIWDMAHLLEINLEWEGGDWVSLNEHNDEDAYFINTWELVSEELIYKMEINIKVGEKFATEQKNKMMKRYIIIGLNSLRKRLRKFKKNNNDLFKKGG